MAARMLDARELREAVRAGEHTGPTAGLAPGYTQANLVALPEADAFDFLRFCVAEPQALPGARRHRRRLARAGADGARAPTCAPTSRATGSGATASWSTSRPTRASTGATTSSAS